MFCLLINEKIFYAFYIFFYWGFMNIHTFSIVVSMLHRNLHTLYLLKNTRKKGIWELFSWKWQSSFVRILWIFFCVLTNHLNIFLQWLLWFTFNGNETSYWITCRYPHSHSIPFTRDNPHDNIHKSQIYINFIECNPRSYWKILKFPNWDLIHVSLFLSVHLILLFSLNVSEYYLHDPSVAWKSS